MHIILCGIALPNSIFINLIPAFPFPYPLLNPDYKNQHTPAQTPAVH
jgi:hypothetical protein